MISARGRGEGDHDAERQRQDERQQKADQRLAQRHVAVVQSSGAHSFEAIDDGRRRGQNPGRQLENGAPHSHTISSAR